MLLAASKPSGGGDFGDLPAESTRFEFPLYLNITQFDYEDEYVTEYVRESDGIGSQLEDWLRPQLSDELYLDDSCRIYINGEQINSIVVDYGTFYFHPAPAPFDDVFLDGSTLYASIYK